MLELLKKHFGYDRFRKPQEEVILRVCEGKDTLVVMPTGGGKSLCYQLPALVRDGTALVISPLLSLMKDQVDALCAHGIEAASLNSSLTPDEMQVVTERLRSRKLKLLYVAPERLANASFRALIATCNISLVAIDEAHCISEWGHDFRPEYRQLASVRELCPNVPIIALTATATETVQTDILKQLKMDRTGLFVSGFDRPNLCYIVVPKKGAFASLVHFLDRHRGESAIVYCLSRKRTEEVAEKLRAQGMEARAYHAGLDSRVRIDIQDRFIKDQISVVVATVAFGMGIDKPDVRIVVHYDLPKSVEGYYQETGRAGRDGLPSECVLLYSYGDVRTHQYFLAQVGPVEREKGERQLRAMINYGDSRTCRREYLLRYFGQKVVLNRCENCDVCLGFKMEAVREALVVPLLKKKSSTATVLSDADRPLFERLRILRRTLAQEHHVPPYIIFGDKSLIQMATDRPRTNEAFSKISGVGAHKLEAFAEIFLAEIGKE